MSDFPFGFGVPSEGDDDDARSGSGDSQGSAGRGGRPGGGDGNIPGGGAPSPGGEQPFQGGNPFEALLGSMSSQDLGAALQQLGRLLSQESGPVNWELAHDTARQAVATQPDPSPNAADRAAVAEAVRLAEHWLDTATSLPAGTTSASAWSRAEWVEATLPAWRRLVEPIAARLVATLGEAVPDEVAQMAGPLIGVMRSMGGAMFGAQLGQALGSLAGEVVGTTDIGVPLVSAGKAALIPTNVAAFGEGLGIPADQVRLFLALREAAHHRLFAHVPWLGQHLYGAVEAYACGIAVDTSRLEEAMSRIDPTNPESLQEAFESGLFTPPETAQQKAALARLETALALVEGWVDAVVDTAARDRLPAAGALRETVRRRRAAGGPAEETFSTLVGLELRPRRLREASVLWASLAEVRGRDGRDALWAHPDLLPTAEDLDDPDGFVHREELDLSDLVGDLGAEREASAGDAGADSPGDSQDSGTEPGDGGGATGGGRRPDEP